MRRIISVLLENEAGALSRVVGLFAQRNYNIESLTVAPTEDATLAESVEFESEENYRAKLVTLRKSYFPEHASAPADETENLSEEANFQEEIHSPSMDAYLRALSNVAKK